MEKVSIIVPVYNKANSIKRCLQSICKQTWDNIEIICVDDGSTDNTLLILKDLQKKDNRIVLVSKENGGPSSARNEGLKIASGSYIQFVDSDDEIESNMTEILVNKAEEKSADIVICGYKIRGSNSIIRVNRGLYNSQEFREKFVILNQSFCVNPPWNKLYKKELLSNLFDEELYLGEDLVFNISYLKNCKSILLIEDSPYIYSLNEKGALCSAYKDCYFKNTNKKIIKLLDYLSVKENVMQNLGKYIVADYVMLLKMATNTSYKSASNLARTMIYDKEFINIMKTFRYHSLRGVLVMNAPMFLVFTELIKKEIKKVINRI